MKALKTLNKSDISEVKAMKKPPETVKLVLKAVCIMKSVAPQKIPDPNGGVKKIEDYWGPSTKMLTDPQFLQGLMEYDKDNIDPAIVEQIREVIKVGTTEALKSSRSCRQTAPRRKALDSGAPSLFPFILIFICILFSFCLALFWSGQELTRPVSCRTPSSSQAE